MSLLEFTKEVEFIDDNVYMYKGKKYTFKKLWNIFKKSRDESKRVFKTKCQRK